MQAVVNKIKDLVVIPCLEEEESYAVRSRKLAVIAVAIIVSNGLLVGVPATIVSGMYDPSLGAYIAGAGFVQVSVTTSIIPYFYLRYTKKLPDWLVDFQIWTALPIIVVVDLFIHQGSIAILCSLCILLGVVLRVRLWQLLLLIGVIGNVVHVLINHFGDTLPVLHEAFYSTQLLSVRLMYLFGSNICPVIFFGAGLHMIMMEFVQRSEQADAAIAMNLAVADKLRRYDTDGVAEILAANKGIVDENLLEAFTAIQHNLQEYRPHIPDYVIAATMTAEGGSGEEGDDSDDEGGLKISASLEMNSMKSDSIPNTLSQRNELETSNYDERGLDSVQRTSQSNKRSMRGSGALRRRSTAGSTALFQSNELSKDGLDDEDSSASITSGRNESSASLSMVESVRGKGTHSINERPAKFLCKHTSRGSASLNGNGAKKTRQHFYGRATTVFVRFVSAPCGSDGSGNGFVSKGSAVLAMNILSKCVDAGSKLAKAHGGALQYMQGCGLMVSFNAASRVAAHESKACGFALGLKAAVDDILDATVVMHASIVTTNVLSFFAGNGGQLMLTVLGGFMPQHTAMHHYLSQTVGREASCVLLSDSVVPTIEMLYEHRLLGGLQYAVKTSPTEYSPISQLLTHKTVEDDEWLYQLTDRKDTDIIDVTNKIVLAALEGTRDVMEKPNRDEDIIFEKCVTDRIAECRKSGSPFYSMMIPTVMW